MSRPSGAGASRCIARVRGSVQGVGFRPFVYRKARALGLRGAVWNDPDGVMIDAEGEAPQLESLLDALYREAPTPARVEAVEVLWAEARGSDEFEIHESDSRPAQRPRLVPDLATCPACQAELFDREDRRYGYAFLNCTACGPRYSIAHDVPYDRARTSMEAFRQCQLCAAEYADPASRRFHAQPNACPKCGPQLRLEPGFAHAGDPRDALAATVAALRRGRIVALKGLGGFQLCCDARSEAAVARLRQRKRRPRKPLAVMFPDLEAVERTAHLDAVARESLLSPQAPIVLLALRAGAELACGIAPGLDEVGALLPYTPLHHQLLALHGEPLVMTSGNLADEPLAFRDDEARERLGAIADHLLLHDRGIETPVDDSLVRVVDGAPRLLRRARGFVPETIELGFEAPPLVAVGADLKNTLCLTVGGAAVLSQHIGDLEQLASQRFHAEVRAHLERLFQVRPEAVAHDLHPGYSGTALARASGLPCIGVQHHHAHVAACLVENGASGPAIGVAWDGTGYGLDGSVWGGEFLVADLAGFERHGRLRPVPLPGGAAAIREPWRMAASHLWASGLRPARFDAPQADSLAALLRGGANTPLTSSAGRLFDAAAALLGVCERQSHEGQAAAELEALAAQHTGEAPPYPFAVAPAEGLLELDPRPLWIGLLRDLERGTPRSAIARRFHASLAQGVADTCVRIREASGLDSVALTGGCFQNRLLGLDCRQRLEAAGFQVLTHSRVPAGDGGLALGQAAVAAWRSRHVSRDPR